MRVVTVLLVAVMSAAGVAGTMPIQLEAVAVASTLEQQPQQPVGPSTQQDEEGLTTAGWANVIWIVLTLVLGVAFVWLAMAGLRSRSRE